MAVVQIFYRSTQEAAAEAGGCLSPKLARFIN